MSKIFNIPVCKNNDEVLVMRDGEEIHKLVVEKYLEISKKTYEEFLKKIEEEPELTLTFLSAICEKITNEMHESKGVKVNHLVLLPKKNDPNKIVLFKPCPKSEIKQNDICINVAELMGVKGQTWAKTVGIINRSSLFTKQN